MKLIKSFFALCVFGCYSLNASAQINTIDLSTGIDANGNQIAVMQDDPRWTVKTPTSNYRAVKKGTGLSYDPPTHVVGGNGALNAPRNYQIINNNKAWLTPFPWTSSSISAYLAANPSTSSLEASSLQIGNMNHTSEFGEYIYRLKFRMTWPDCKRPNSATICVKTLTALGEATEVLLNGQPVGTGSLGNMLSNYWTSNLPGSYGQKAEDVRATLQWINTNSLYSYFPWYYIYVNPQQLVNGDNYLYIKVQKLNDVNARGTGFMCDADLQYTYGPNNLTIPTFNVSGSQYVTPGPVPTLSIAKTNLGSFTATATVTANPSVAGFPITNTTLGNSSPWVINLNSTIPTTYTITVTSNDPNNLCSSVKTWKTYSFQAFVFNPYDWAGRIFKGSADPINWEESAKPGFETKWMLEELNEVTSEPVYRIINPANWNTPIGESHKFLGFNSENNFQGDITELVGNDDSKFSADRIYRLTRSHKSDEEPDWQDYSIVVGPGYNQLEPPPSLSTGLKEYATNKNTALVVYPNPGNGVFTINTNALKNGDEIVLLDAVGKKVQSINCSLGKSTYTIDLTGYAKGVYFLSTQNSTQKIIVE